MWVWYNIVGVVSQMGVVSQKTLLTEIQNAMNLTASYELFMEFSVSHEWTFHGA